MLQRIRICIRRLNLAAAVGAVCLHQAINAALKSTGDLGEVAEGSKKNIRTLYKPPPLTVRQVFQKFKEISTIAGAKSGMKKGNIVKSLLAAGSGLEGRYIVRALQGKMRINMVSINSSFRTVFGGGCCGRVVQLPPPSCVLSSCMI